MADDNRRRRVRDVSESSECESTQAENGSLNLTQCESEVSTLSQGEALSQSEATALSQSVTAASESGEASESGDIYDQDDISGEDSEQTTDAEEAESEDDESKTEDEDSKVEVRRVATDKQVAESETEEQEDAESTDPGSDEEAWKKERRHSGDGEEQKETVGEKQDIDNDRSNPAYIPRKGMFYEHDLRIGDGGGDEKELDVTGDKKKKLWLECHKWNHDRYDERSQAPKTERDLVAEYGYDIRLGTSPPNAKPQRSRGNRRPRGSRQLGDYIKPSDNFHNESNQDSYAQLRSTSGNVSSEQSHYQSSDGRYRSTDDVSNHRQRGNQRFERRGKNMHSGQVNRGRSSSTRVQQSRKSDDDQLSPTCSDDESSQQGNIPQENRQNKQDYRHESSGRRGRMDKFKNRGNSRNWEGNAARNIQSREVIETSNVRTQNNETESGIQRWPQRERRPNAQSENIEHVDETWEDEEIAVYSENMYARSAAEHSKKANPSPKVVHDARVPRPPHYHATRTISNTQFKNADSDVHGRDRNSQIQNVVASMNKISVGKDPAVSVVHGGSNDSRKLTATSKEFNSSEIIPPVTRAFTRTTHSTVSGSLTSSQDISQTVTRQANIPRTALRDDLPASRDSASVAFRPVTRIPANSEVSLQQLQSQVSKPKRYSTQRQRGQLDTGDSTDVATELSSEQVVPQVSASYSLPPRLQRNKYNDEEALRLHMLQFPSRSVLASGQPAGNVAYSVAGVQLPPKFYQSQPLEATQQATESQSTLMHAARYLAPRQMIPTAHAQPGQYYQAQPMYNYVPMQATYIPPPTQSHYRMTAPPPSQVRPYVAPAAPSPQMMSEVSPSMEVRGGTVYFNAETQQPELRVGGIYYGPTGSQSGGASMPGLRPSSAIPIVNPQEAIAAGDGLHYYTNEYVSYEHYVASPVPYEASSVCLPDSSVEGGYA